MLKIKTKLGLSTIEGIGLFADEFIAKGTVIWEFHEKLDTLWTKEEIDSLADEAKYEVFKYSYIDSKYQKYVLCGDDARFFNHSDNPNCSDTYDINPDVTVANRDIQKGEELTCDYKSFYGNIEEHPEID